MQFSIRNSSRSQQRLQQSPAGLDLRIFFLDSYPESYPGQIISEGTPLANEHYQRMNTIMNPAL